MFASGVDLIPGDTNDLADVYIGDRPDPEDFADADQDGILDCYETGGIKTGYGTITTDPGNDDHDGDSLRDGFEVGVPVSVITYFGDLDPEAKGDVIFVGGFSNPILADTCLLYTSPSPRDS